MTITIQTASLNAATAANFSDTKKTSSASFKEVLASASKPTAAQELDDYMRKSPAERMQDMILKSMGLTREELATKTPAEQASIMAQINRIMQQKMEEAAAKAGGSSAGTGAGSSSAV